MLSKLRWARFFIAALMATAVLVACARSRPSAPTSPEASPIALEATPGNKFVKAGASQAIIAKIDLTTPKRASALRPPVNVALLVDTSGSMEGKPIADARAATLAMLDAFAPEDRVSVIVFHSKAEILLSSTRIKDADMKELKKKVGAMKAQGTTDMHAGLQLALDEVSRDLVKEGVNRVVLVGDGVPNADNLIPSHVALAQAKGISITTLGLGNDYDETLMGRIAQQTGGKFAYIEDSSKVASFFKEEVTRLHRVVARNATLDLRPGPGVTVQNVIGRPASRMDRGLTVVLGDVVLGEKQELVVELAANGAKDGANVEALDAVLRWTDSVGTEVHEERVFLGLKATTDEARIAASKDEEVANAFARAKDAAATLQKIENERMLQNAAQRGGAGAAPPAPMPMEHASPAKLRKSHDEAIQNFQAH
jgi:Ca-activated chloride channel homolog